MKDNSAFHAAMAELLQHMGIAPPGGQENEAYELQFSEDGKIFFSCIEPGSIDAIAEAGMLRHPDDAAVLLDLLELNQAVVGQPLVHIGIDRAGMRIVIRARVDLASATRDSLVSLTWAMTGRLAAVRACLDRTAPARGKPGLPPAREGTLKQLGLKRT